MFDTFFIRSRPAALVAALTLCASTTTHALTQDPPPPTGPYRLAYTFTSPTEVAFMDLASLERMGDVVEGWSLNVFKEPFKPDYAPMAAAMHWSRVRIDCAAQTARFTRGVGMVDGVPAFDVPIAMADTRVQDGWVLDEQYACKGQPPARPVVESLDTAIEDSTAIMSSDAWTEDAP